VLSTGVLCIAFRESISNLCWPQERVGEVPNRVPFVYLHEAKGKA
jgi:hypothetical protein